MTVYSYHYYNFIISDNIGMQNTENTNEWINWIEEAIDKNFTNTTNLVILKKLVQEVSGKFFVQIGKILKNILR